VLVELANETVAAAQQTSVCFRFRCRIRKRGTGDGIVRSSEASMRMRGFNGRPVNNETEQQKRERASKDAVLLN
jgi:hypothetical protein